MTPPATSATSPLRHHRSASGGDDLPATAAAFLLRLRHFTGRLVSLTCPTADDLAGRGIDVVLPAREGGAVVRRRGRSRAGARVRRRVRPCGNESIDVDESPSKEPDANPTDHPGGTRRGTGGRSVQTNVGKRPSPVPELKPRHRCRRFRRRNRLTGRRTSSGYARRQDCGGQRRSDDEAAEIRPKGHGSCRVLRRRGR